MKLKSVAESTSEFPIMLSVPGAKTHQEATNLSWWQQKQNDYIQVNCPPKYAELHSEINYMGWLSIMEYVLTALYFFPPAAPISNVVLLCHKMRCNGFVQ